MKRRWLLRGCAVGLLGALVWFLIPVHGFIAEDLPRLRGPWGWTEVPGEAPYKLGVARPEFSAAARKAQVVLQSHRARIGAPALSAAVAINGELVWSAASGWADIERNLQATPETLFRIGSTSKPVTGTLLARFVDAGLVDLDTAIVNYLPVLPNPQWEPITLRQLASHSAGLPDYATNRDWRGLYASGALRQRHSDVRQSLENFDDMDLRHTPGTFFEYSSFGTTLLAAVLQEVGGKPYQILLRDWVTAPLSIETPIPDTEQPLRSEFYQIDGTRVKLWRKVDLSNKLAGGGLMSRPEDLVILGSAWLDESFISAPTRTRFWTPQVLADGAVNEQNYALTWRWSETAHMANHGGVSKGAMAWLAVYPEQKLVIALSTNTTLPEFSDFSEVQGQLVDIFSHGRK